MKFVHHKIRRNILNWNGGTHTLIMEFRGNKLELIEKLRTELQLEIDRNKW